MRNLTELELREFYAARRPDQKLKVAVDLGIIKIKDERFVRQNEVPRSIKEMPSIRRALIHFRDKECAYCGDTENLTVDHLIPFSAWPEHLIWLANTSSNLVSACWDCNRIKSANLYQEPPYKQVWPIVENCDLCRPTNCQCESLSVWCSKCRQAEMTSICRLPKIECEGN